MDYFMMQTDKHLRRLPQFQIPKEMKNIEDKKIIRDNRAVPVICVEGYNGLEIEYPDYIEKPIPLIADKFGYYFLPGDVNRKENRCAKAISSYSSTSD